MKAKPAGVGNLYGTMCYKHYGVIAERQKFGARSQVFQYKQRDGRPSEARLRAIASAATEQLEQGVIGEHDLPAFFEKAIRP